MTADGMRQRLRKVCLHSLPLPGTGQTSERHRALFETAREDVALAKLAEAHWDAIAILAEAGRTPQADSIYAVWASETQGAPLRLEKSDGNFLLSGNKPFCSGIGIVDRALVTVGSPDHLLVEVDLHNNDRHIAADLSVWKTEAFQTTQTGSLTFNTATLDRQDLICGPRWYLERAGFWHGACGPAACWAGGVAGLVDFAQRNKRDDPHTLAHFGAMKAGVWAMLSLLSECGREIDASPKDAGTAQVRALQFRHLIVEMASDVLRRFAQAYGPHPLSMNEEVSRRFHEVHLYMRQSHSERDLETLATLVRHSDRATRQR